MKRYINILFLMLLFIVGACSEQEHQHAEGTTYTCPMHPQVVQNEPGTCPVCGMDLVPQASHGAEVEVTDDLTFLLEPTNQTVVSTISTIKPELKSVPTTVDMEGLITYDERKIYSIPARVSGRIENLYVKYNFQPVQKGQKLLELYSPEMVTAQKELLYLVRSAPEDKAIIASAKQKLRYLGATDAQINQLLRTGQTSYTFAVYSPYEGYVIGLNVAAPTATPGTSSITSPSSGSGMDAMGGGAERPGQSGSGSISTTNELQLREGMYVTTGQPLLRVVNPNQLWAEFNLPASELNTIAKGTSVKITFPQLPGETMVAKIDFVQPFYEAGENFAKVRVYLPGQQKIARVGQLVTGKATVTAAPALWVPRDAVMDIGTKSVVFKMTAGAYKPVSVTIGNKVGNQIQIISGIEEDDIIASNAQFMIDSESFIKVNNENN